MTSYFVLPSIGKLEIEHVFYQLGIDPVLFVCRDTNGLRYLCSCCTLGEAWVVGQAETADLLDMMNDRITIREVFENRCKSVFLLLWDGEKYSSCDSLDGCLPQQGAYLELEDDVLNSYREALKNSDVI